MKIDAMTFYTNKVKKLIEDGYVMEYETVPPYYFHSKITNDFIKGTKLVRVTMEETDHKPKGYRVVVASNDYHNIPKHAIWTDMMTIITDKRFE